MSARREACPPGAISVRVHTSSHLWQTSLTYKWALLVQQFCQPGKAHSAPTEECGDPWLCHCKHSLLDGLDGHLIPHAKGVIVLSSAPIRFPWREGAKGHLLLVASLMFWNAFRLKRRSALLTKGVAWKHRSFDPLRDQRPWCDVPLVLDTPSIAIRVQCT